MTVRAGKTGGVRTPCISPFYSPCLSFHCGAVPGSHGVPHLGSPPACVGKTWRQNAAPGAAPGEQTGTREKEE